jgi:hypothetical protein
MMGCCRNSNYLIVTSCSLEMELKQLEAIFETPERRTYLEGQLATVDPDAPSGGEGVMSPAERRKP